MTTVKDYDGGKDRGPRNAQSKVCFDLKTDLLIGFCFIFSTPDAWAQTAEREKPKLKKFGSSLKRLKWDAEKNAAVEVADNKEKSIGNGFAAAGGGSEEDVVRVATTLVVSDVLVTDKQGRPVEGLTRDDFVVNEDDQLQQVESFSLGANSAVPRSIVLIIDYSGSQFPFIKDSIAAAKTLIDKLNPNDRMAVVTDDVEVISEFTRDKQKLKKTLDSLEKKALAGSLFFNYSNRFGRSQQYSALMATLREAFDAEDIRPIVIFQTDGDELSTLQNAPPLPQIPQNLPPDLADQLTKNAKRLQQYNQANLRQFSINDIYKAAEKSRSTIYTVIPGYKMLGLPEAKQIEQFKFYRERSMKIWMPKQAARLIEEESSKNLPDSLYKYQVDQFVSMQTALTGVAERTGGWTEFLEDPAQAEDIYSRIFSDINRRYIVGYYPTNGEINDKRRKVSIEVRDHPDYVIWGRKSYIPSNR